MTVLLYLYAALIISLAAVQVAAAAKKGPIRIFILAGDGAAEGFASLSQLKELTESEPDRYSHLIAEDSKSKSSWKVRDDVYVAYQAGLDKRWDHKPLSADMGMAHSPEEFGPEVELGVILGEVYQEPVIIVKCTWDGRSLAKDFRPPSAGGATGRFYKQIILDVKHTVANMNDILRGQALKDYRNAAHSIEGMVWWHGYSDLEVKESRETYSANLKMLMGDIRRDLGSPFLPFVVGELGGMGTRHVTLFEHNFRVYQERAVKDDPVKMSQFVKTHDRLDQRGTGYDQVDYEYYYHQAGFMIKIGAAFAEGLLLLMNGDDDAARGGAANVNPYTATEGEGDFERFEENKHNKIILMFGGLMFGSVLFYAVTQNGLTRRALSSVNLQAGWTRTMEKIRPAVRAVIPTDDDGNLVLGVMVLPTNAMSEAAGNSLAYVDSRARSTYAYADETVRSFRIPEVQFVIRTSESADNNIAEVQDDDSDLQAEMVAA